MENKIAFYLKPFPRINTYYQLIDLSVEYGFTTVEGFTQLGLSEPDVEEARRIRQYADEKGVTFCCFSLYAHIVGPNGRAEIERIKRYTDVAHVLGSPYIHHTITPEFDPKGKTLEEIDAVFWEAIEGLREIYDYAATLGMRAIYEDQAFLFNGIAGFERLYEVVDRDIGIVADFGNIRQVDELICPFIERFHDKIAHVHAKDVVLTEETGDGTYPTLHGNRFKDHVRYGEGIADMHGAVQLLKKYGYTGSYSLEYGARSDSSTSVDDNIRLLRAWLDE